MDVEISSIPFPNDKNHSFGKSNPKTMNSHLFSSQLSLTTSDSTQVDDVLYSKSLMGFMSYSFDSPKGKRMIPYPSNSSNTPNSSRSTLLLSGSNAPESPNGNISDTQLILEIRKIVAHSDNSQITKNHIFRLLQDKFQMNLSHKKEFIDKTIDRVVLYH